MSKGKQQENRFLAIGIMIFILTIFNDGLISLGAINNIKLLPLGFLAVIFSKSTAASVTSALTYINLKIADREVLTLNNNLEATVAERTHDLQVKTEELAQNYQQVEKQNFLLNSSYAKLEDGDKDKERILARLSNFSGSHLEGLSNILVRLQTEDASKEELTKEAMVEVDLIKKVLNPIKKRYLSEKAIRSRMVLIVEDDMRQLSLSKLALSGTGVKLMTAANSDEAKKHVNEHNFDVILISEKYLKFSAYAHKKAPNVKIVLCTSGAMNSYVYDLHKYPFLSNIIQRDAEDTYQMTKNIRTTVSKIVNADIFGLEKYLSWGVDVHKAKITGTETKSALLDNLEAH